MAWPLILLVKITYYMVHRKILHRLQRFRSTRLLFTRQAVNMKSLIITRHQNRQTPQEPCIGQRTILLHLVPNF